MSRSPGAKKGPQERERQKRKWRKEKGEKKEEKKREMETFQIPGRVPDGAPTTSVIITQSLKYKTNNGALGPHVFFFRLHDI